MKLYTMGEAAKLLGRDDRGGAQWLRRRLLKREADVGRLIMVRSGGTRPHYRVSLATLRRYVPELIDPRDDVQRGLKALVGAQKLRDERTAGRLDEVEAQISLLTETIASLRQEIRGLGQQRKFVRRP